MNLDFDNERPIYLQIVEKVTTDIISGKLKKGEKIPSVREYAFILKVNPNTMQKALSELEDRGLIYTERTNGKYVTEDEELIKSIKMSLANEKTKIFFENMNSIGIDYEETLKYIEKIGGKNGTC